jgi:hypothetical protein
MKRFLSKHGKAVKGVIGCFDRVVFKGYLPISAPGSMESFMAHKGVLIKDFKKFVQHASARVKGYARAMAERTGRPMRRCRAAERKEDAARAIARIDGVTRGLVCVFSAVETCPTFSVRPAKGRPKLVADRRPCLCLYFYFLDRTLGLFHVRLQTWFPFTVQICLNGHDVLASQLDLRGVAYEKVDNAFVSMADCERAQKLADGFEKRDWSRTLSYWARRVNPLLKDLLGTMDYHWVVDQGEYATDVLFTSPEALQSLFDDWFRHASLCFGADDLMTFLGRKLTGRFQGEVISRAKRRWPGARIRHRIGKNWMKMYIKHGCILRIETVINYPYDFRIRRPGKRQGRWIVDWFPMCKAVGNLYRYREICQAANARYLDALAAVEPVDKVRRQIAAIAQPVRHNERCWRGFNPASVDDIALFAAVCRGEHQLRGFRNAHIRQHLFGTSKNPIVERRQSAAVSRLIKRLHLHGLVAKIPRSRRWRVSAKGQLLMAVFLTLHHQQYPEAALPRAA